MTARQRHAATIRAVQRLREKRQGQPLDLPRNRDPEIRALHERLAARELARTVHEKIRNRGKAPNA